MSSKPAFLSRFTPSLMPPEALEEILVQREELARRILSRLRESALSGSPHHTLLVGPRGIGKTHLISLLYYRLRRMSDLRSRLLLAWLREEEFGITSFLDLMLRILQAVAAEGENGAELAARIQTLYSLPPQEAENGALKLIRGFTGGRALLVLVENLDDLFERLGYPGQTRLERFLRENPFCSLLATAQVLPDYMSAPGVPLSGLFEVHRLEELSDEDALRLLSKIAAYRRDHGLAAFLTTPRGRARTRALRYLAGGNHRAYVIFSQFLTRESLDDLIEPLMRTIDDLTPYYQARMAWLSPPQRKIIAFMCECRHPAPLLEIARHSFMSVEGVSFHLESLQKMGYLNAILVGQARYYELREPLMRLSVEVKKHRGQPVRLLVDFLRLWFSPAELQQRMSALPADAGLERFYALPALEATREEGEHPRVPACCREYNAAVQRGDIARALLAAEELVTIRGTAADRSAQASCLRSLGRFDAALACYESILASDPQDASVWVLRGAMLDRLGRHQEALDVLAKAIELDPASGRAWQECGAVHLRAGRPEQALSCYEHAIDLNPEDASSYLSRGIALSDLCCYEEASCSFTKATELDPDDEMPYIYRCAALIELKLFGEALDCAQKAARLRPEQRLAWVLQGTVQAAMGRHGEALTALDRAIDLGEESSFAYFKRAHILLATGRWREGSAALDDALGRFAHSDSPMAENTVELIRVLQQRLHDQRQLRLRIQVLVLLHRKHKLLSALGQGLVESIPDLLSPLFSDTTAQWWLDLWQELAGDQSEFRLPLGLLGAAVAYRNTRDLRVLLELPAEERVLLESLLSIKFQATA